MKKTLHMMALVLVSLLMSMTASSCGDDNDNLPAPDSKLLAEMSNFTKNEMTYNGFTYHIYDADMYVANRTEGELRFLFNTAEGRLKLNLSASHLDKKLDLSKLDSEAFCFECDATDNVYNLDDDDYIQGNDEELLPDEGYLFVHEIKKGEEYLVNLWFKNNGSTIQLTFKGNVDELIDNKMQVNSLANDEITEATYMVKDGTQYVFELTTAKGKVAMSLPLQKAGQELDLTKDDPTSNASKYSIVYTDYSALHPINIYGSAEGRHASYGSIRYYNLGDDNFRIKAEYGVGTGHYFIDFYGKMKQSSK